MTIEGLIVKVVFIGTLSVASFDAEPSTGTTDFSRVFENIFSFRLIPLNSVIMGTVSVASITYSADVLKYDFGRSLKFMLFVAIASFSVLLLVIFV